MFRVQHSVSVPEIMYEECSITLEPGEYILNDTNIRPADNLAEAHWYYTKLGQPFHHYGEHE
jgi:hypothetical protein